MNLMLIAGYGVALLDSFNLIVNNNHVKSEKIIACIPDLWQFKKLKTHGG